MHSARTMYTMENRKKEHHKNNENICLLFTVLVFVLFCFVFLSACVYGVWLCFVVRHLTFQRQIQNNNMQNANDKTIPIIYSNYR